MPKSTFFNLPEEKRNRITEVAIDEFINHTYRNANITRIVNNSGIAKGSFYQYFDDKKDLYKYVIDISFKLKMDYLKVRLTDLEQSDFFQVVRELYAAGLVFAKNNPKLAAIGNNLMRDNDTNFKDQILEDSIQKTNGFFESLLIKGIQRGSIIPNIDVKLTAFLIMSLSISLSEYYMKECKKDSDIMVLVDKMLYVIENGLRGKKEDNRDVES
ncbi:TetR/AcrR family transcriptional regulator [Lutispora sp.]|uniref:TetR/AcrR family transcriptional regulator n=1 Tax=Lutispora sp. TaxID=2828727 RepID=UPI002B21E17A|nr:TetR/AcrR family transcriptional regulator [Lutispora sp.]MEA4962239.1 TetR/AcrR family transcriptional regulator [Lutispora sp.]